MEKKYRVKRYFYGIVDGKKYLVNSIIIDANIADNDKQFDVNFLLKSGHIEEVKEEKPMENNLVGEFHCMNCGKKLICGESCDCKSEPMEQKKYRLKKDLPDCKVGEIFVKSNVNDSYWSKRQYHEISGYNKKFVENNPEWFEELKEDTMESILDDFPTPTVEFKNKMYQRITDWYNKEVIKREIELIKDIRYAINLSIGNGKLDLKNKDCVEIDAILENKLKEIK